MDQYFWSDSFLNTFCRLRLHLQIDGPRQLLYVICNSAVQSVLGREMKLIQPYWSKYLKVFRQICPPNRYNFSFWFLRSSSPQLYHSFYVNTRPIANPLIQLPLWTQLLFWNPVLLWWWFLGLSSICGETNDSSVWFDKNNSPFQNIPAVVSSPGIFGTLPSRFARLLGLGSRRERKTNVHLGQKMVFSAFCFTFIHCWPNFTSLWSSKHFQNLEG